MGGKVGRNGVKNKISKNKKENVSKKKIEKNTQTLQSNFSFCVKETWKENECEGFISHADFKFPLSFHLFSSFVLTFLFFLNANFVAV